MPAVMTVLLCSLCATWGNSIACPVLNNNSNLGSSSRKEKFFHEFLLAKKNSCLLDETILNRIVHHMRSRIDVVTVNLNRWCRLNLRGRYENWKKFNFINWNCNSGFCQNCTELADCLNQVRKAAKSLLSPIVIFMNITWSAPPLNELFCSHLLPNQVYIFTPGIKLRSVCEVYPSLNEPYPLANLSFNCLIEKSRKYAYNFNGENLKVCYMILRPYVYRNYFGDLKGVEIDILTELSNLHNFTFTLIPSPDRDWGTLQENGTWTGCYKLLLDEEVDVAIGGFGMTPSRFRVSDFSKVYNHGKWIIISNVPYLKPEWLALLKPFDSFVWITVVLCIIFMSVVHSFILYYLSKVVNFDNSTRESQFGLFDAIGILSEEATTNNYYSYLTYKVVLLTWIIASMTLLWYYQANLLSYLVTPDYTSPINSIKDLESSDLRILTFPTAIAKDFLEQNPTINVRRMVIYGNMTTVLKMILEYPKKYSSFALKDALMGYIVDNMNITYNDISSLFYFGKETVVINFDAIVFGKQKPLMQIFSLTINEIVETGLINFWYNQEFNYSSSDVSLDRYSHKKSTTSPLSMNHLEGAYALFCIFVAVSAVVFLMEILVKYRKARNSK